MYCVREITPADAGAYWQLRQQLDGETEFLQFEPDDWLVTTQRVRGRIELILATDNQTIFVAEHEGQLIGFLWAGGGLYRNNHHNVHIILGVRQAFHRQKLGTRLELSVMTHNFPALALYTKLGFHVEGTAPSALCLHGKYIDLHYMSKVLTCHHPK